MKEEIIARVRKVEAENISDKSISGHSYIIRMFKQLKKPEKQLEFKEVISELLVHYSNINDSVIFYSLLRASRLIEIGGLDRILVQILISDSLRLRKYKEIPLDLYILKVLASISISTDSMHKISFLSRKETRLGYLNHYLQILSTNNEQETLPIIFEKISKFNFNKNKVINVQVFQYSTILHKIEFELFEEHIFNILGRKKVNDGYIEVIKVLLELFRKQKNKIAEQLKEIELILQLRKLELKRWSDIAILYQKYNLKLDKNKVGKTLGYTPKDDGIGVAGVISEFYSNFPEVLRAAAVL